MKIKSLFYSLFTAFILSLSLACSSGGGGDSIANRGGISGTGDVSLSKSIHINSFELAHQSYGARTKSTFSLNTLAPVFKIQAENVNESNFHEILSIQLTDSSTANSIQLENLNDHARIVYQTEEQAFYIFIFKSNSISLDQYNLKPGHIYTYAVTAKNNYELIYDHSNIHLAGSFETKNITFTYPHQKSSIDSMVYVANAPLTGIDSLNPNFLIHSKYEIVGFDSSLIHSGYGITDQLKVVVNGHNLFKAGYSNLTFEEGTPKALKIKVTSGLSKGLEYRLQLQSSNLKVKTETQSTRIVTTQELPQTMLIHTK